MRSNGSKVERQVSVKSFNLQSNMDGISETLKMKRQNYL